MKKASLIANVTFAAVATAVATALSGCVTTGPNRSSSAPDYRTPTGGLVVDVPPGIDRDQSRAQYGLHMSQREMDRVISDCTRTAERSAQDAARERERSIDTLKRTSRGLSNDGVSDAIGAVSAIFGALGATDAVSRGFDREAHIRERRDACIQDTVNRRMKYRR